MRTPLAPSARPARTSTGTRVPAARPGVVVGGTAVAIAVSWVATALVATVALLAGASPQFSPLSPAAYVPAVAVGVLAGVAGWLGVRRWSRRPAATMRWLVPVVVGLSLVPDVALLWSGEPGATLLGVVALMAMHLLVAAVTVPVLARTAPLSR